LVTVRSARHLHRRRRPGLDEAIRSALHPLAVHPDLIAYLMLVTTVTLDALALEITLRPVHEQAARRVVSLRHYLRRSTDPASTTNVVGGGCAIFGGVTAIAGLVLCEVTGSPSPDAVATALIGLLLLIASAFLLGTNRDLLSGRGLPPPTVRQMSRVIAAHAGVVDVRTCLPS
jgi:divalent metal cation (Fe/Co/Zn/Cd) transporter